MRRSCSRWIALCSSHACCRCCWGVRARLRKAGRRRLPPGDRNGLEKPTVAFVTNGIASFWLIAEAGAKKAAQDFNVNVEVREPPEAGNLLQIFPLHFLCYELRDDLLFLFITHQWI